MFNKDGKNTLPLISDANPLKVAWDILIICAIWASSILIPFELAFGLEKINAIYWLVTILFSLDILVSFNTNTMSHHKEDANRSENAVGYLKSWFAIDFISALPWAFLLSLAGFSGIVLLNLAHALRLIRLFRLVKVKTTLKHIALHMNPAFLKLFIFFFWFILLVHSISTGWILVHAIRDNMEPLRVYVLAVYWTVTTIGGVGYGDIVPDKSSYLEIIYTIGVELVGVGVFGYIIGNISSLVSNLDMTKAAYQKKMEEVDTFFRIRKVPHALHEKVRNYYAYVWNTRRTADLNDVVSGLPHTLQIEISMFLNREVIQKVALFHDMNKEFIHELVLMLEPMVFLPKDHIIREGEYGDCMYFLVSGKVEVITKNTKVAELSSGSPFGEGALINNERRNASVRTIDYCDVYKLSKANFDVLRQRYPDFDAHVKTIVEQRKKDTASKLF